MRVMKLTSRLTSPTVGGRPLKSVGKRGVRLLPRFGKGSGKCRYPRPRFPRGFRHEGPARRGRGLDRRAARGGPAPRGLRRSSARRPAPQALAAGPADVVLLDLRLPDIDGYAVCRGLRERSDVPIIMVTARGEEVDRVIGLELGADDYVVKPFGLRELIARIHAVTRRTQPRPSPGRCASGRSRWTSARAAHASTATELALTREGVRPPRGARRRARRGRHAAAAARQVWDTTWYGQTKTIDVHVGSLRRKLGDPGWIETVRGVGFRLRPCREPPAAPQLPRLALLVLLVLEVPLGIAYGRNERADLTGKVERDAVAIASLSEDALQGARQPRARSTRSRSATSATRAAASCSSTGRGSRWSTRGAAVPRDLRHPARDRGGAPGPGRHGRPLLEHARHEPPLRRRAGRLGRGRCTAPCASPTRPRRSTRA